jgi:hypothetical protein
MAISVQSTYETLMDSSNQQLVNAEQQQTPFAIPSLTNALRINDVDQDTDGVDSGFKRLHISNIPFRYREHDLRKLLGVRIHQNRKYYTFC